jgi:predicted RNase H-like HicB family nuclease
LDNFAANFLSWGGMNFKLTKVFQQVPHGFIAFVEELPGANAQGETLEEAKSNLEEAMLLVLEAKRAITEERIAGQDVIGEAV